MSGDTYSSHNLGDYMPLASMKTGQDAAKHLIQHRETPHNKNYWTPKVHSAAIRDLDLNHSHKIKSIASLSFMYFSKEKKISRLLLLLF